MGDEIRYVPYGLVLRAYKRFDELEEQLKEIDEGREREFFIGKLTGRAAVEEKYSDSNDDIVDQHELAQAAAAIIELGLSLPANISYVIDGVREHMSSTFENVQLGNFTAQQFTDALNEVMAEKAKQAGGRGGRE